MRFRESCSCCTYYPFETPNFLSLFFSRIIESYKYFPRRICLGSFNTFTVLAVDLYKSPDGLNVTCLNLCTREKAEKKFDDRCTTTTVFMQIFFCSGISCFDDNSVLRAGWRILIIALDWYGRKRIELMIIRKARFIA